MAMKAVRWFGITIALVGMVSVGFAQDSWQTHRGNNARTGVTTNSVNSSVNLRLTWTFPFVNTIISPAVIDNDSTNASFQPAGAWIVPPTPASDAYRENPNTTEPYRYAICTRTEGPNPVRFTWSSGLIRPGYYRIFVHVPSGETPLTPARSYARYARYTVRDSRGSNQTVFINQQVGGWIPLSEAVFYHDGTTSMEVVLDNLIVPESPDYNETGVPEPIVVADAVRFVPDYGTTKASPVVIRNPLNPSNHLVYVANGNGTVTCLESTPPGTVRVRWSFRVPSDSNTVGGQVYDDRNPAVFTAGTFVSNSDLSDAYDTLYHSSEPSNDPNNTQRAYWTIRVPQDGNYYIYAWFPSEANNAQQAQYLIEHEGGTLNLRIDQRNGGRWVRLNNIPLAFRNGQTYEISVTNFSPEDVRLGSRRVIADAIRVENAETGQNGVYSTPAVGQVTVGGNQRWVVVFGAENGRVYCLDALGDGQNGTRPGETQVFWAVKPNLSGPFSFASPLIIEDRDLVIIGNSAGRVFAIRTNHTNSNDESSFLRWQYALGNGAFYSTPAYDGSTVYIGSVEAGGLFGRLYALNPTTNDDDNRLLWAYPPLDKPAIEPITSTPAVANGRVYFASGGASGGRVYAVSTSGAPVWQSPPATAPLNNLIDFRYSSPLVVSVDYNRNGNPMEMVYIGMQNGRILALNATDGNILDISENLGGAIFSSPVYTRVVDTDRTGAQFGSIPAVVVGVNNGRMMALYADNRRNSRNGKAFEGWKLYADTLFSSPAVLDNWLYISDDAGVVYAFNQVGTLTGDILEDIGIEDIPEPDQPETTPENDYSQLKVTVTDEKPLVDDLRAMQIGPHQVPPKWRDAFEWGETFYVIVWNFKHNTGNQPQVQIVGPGLTDEKGTNPKILVMDARLVPNDEYRNVVIYEFRINPSGQKFWTPGRGFELQVSVGGSSWQSDLDFTTPEVDRPATSNPANATEPGDPGSENDLTTPAGWRFGVANPLGLQAIGVVGTGATQDNLVQGNGGITVSANFGGSDTATGEHGKQIFGLFEVRDRRMTTRGVLNVRALANDLRWQGGPSTVIKALPWEVLPSFVNSSPDYPDISARRVSMQARGSTDLLHASILLNNSAWVPVQVQVEIPRYQPPNAVRYLSDKNFVYVDTNNNGRLDGLQLGAVDVNQRRSEAYRELQVATTVRPDPRMVFEEQTIDFGSLPGGFGFSWGTLLPGDNSSIFRPDESIFTPFWKTFTVRNEGNVNLYPVRMGKAFGNPTGTVLFGSDVTGATMPAFTLVQSTLDGRFWLPTPENAEFTTNPFYTPTGGRQPYPILQKPQVGDFAPTTLTHPTLPPRRDPNVPVPPEAQPKLPRVAVAVPPFQPLGTYVTQVSTYAGNDATGIVGNNDPIATPPVRLVVRVRETQLTGSTNRGVQLMIDAPPAQNAPSLSNITPTAFRNPDTGTMHFYWSSNRANPSYPNQFFLYHAPFEWNGAGTLLNGIRTTNGWVPNTPSLWAQLQGPFPNDPSGSLFASALNLGRALTPEEIATIKHTNPVAYMTNPETAWLFWSGEVQLRNQTYSLLFYTPVSLSTGFPTGTIQEVPIDPGVARSHPAMTGVPGVGHWLFYVASPAGRKQVYTIASEGDRFTDWRREQLVPISNVVRSVESVSAQIYPVLATDNQAPFYSVELIIAGSAGDRNESEVLLQRFLIDPRNGNLFSFNDSRATNLLRRVYADGADRILTTMLPMVVDEVAQKDANENVWRVRHLDWVALGREWNEDPTRPDIDIKMNGVSVLVDPNNPIALQEPTYDAETGILQFRFAAPQPNATRVDRGVISVDTRNGTIRFVNFAPGTRDIVSVTYRPRVYRLTPPASGSVGTYSQVFTVFQTIKNPRHNANDPNNSVVRKGTENGVVPGGERPPVDRLWVLFRRAGTSPNSTGNFFYKTLRPGVRLGATIATVRGTLPLQRGGSVLEFDENHATVRLTSNNPAGASVGYYEYDANRGIVFFTTEDLGKEVEVRFLTYVRDANGRVVGTEERAVVQTVRWLDEGNLPGESPEYTSAVPIDLPTNEMYLWAMQNIELRKRGDSTLDSAYGALDEMLLLFWSSTRNGTPEIYGGALQPRFTISVFDFAD